MTWLESGTRRDICILLYDAGELRGQELKRRLGRHYDTRIDPRRFYGRLEALQSSGHIERRVDGVNDVYALTDGGKEAVSRHFEWFSEHVEPSE